MRFKLKIGEDILYCKEMNVSLYKDILKSTYGDQADIETFLETIIEILSTLTGKSSSYFENLSVIDLFSCILQLRINTYGDIVKVNLQDQSSKTSLDLRLDFVNEEIISLKNDYINKELKLKECSVIFESPTPKRLMETIDEDYLYFIKSIKIKEQVFPIQNNQEAKAITEKLPIKVVLDIVNHFEEVITKLRNLNFLARYKVENSFLNFIPTNESLIWFTKLIFNEPLDVFYSNIFYLSHISHIGADYIEKCTPGEYTYFVRKLEATQAERNKQAEETDVYNDFQESETEDF